MIRPAEMVWPRRWSALAVGNAGNNGEPHVLGDVLGSPVELVEERRAGRAWLLLYRP